MLDDELSQTVRELESQSLSATEQARKQQWAALQQQRNQQSALSPSAAALASTKPPSGGAAVSTPPSSQPTTPTKRPVVVNPFAATGGINPNLPASVAASLLELHNDMDNDDTSANSLTADSTAAAAATTAAAAPNRSATGAASGAAVGAKPPHHNSNLISTNSRNGSPKISRPAAGGGSGSGNGSSPYASPLRANHQRNSSTSSHQPALVPVMPHPAPIVTSSHAQRSAAPIAAVVPTRLTSPKSGSSAAISVHTASVGGGGGGSQPVSASVRVSGGGSTNPNYLRGSSTRSSTDSPPPTSASGGGGGSGSGRSSPHSLGSQSSMTTFNAGMPGGQQNNNANNNNTNNMSSLGMVKPGSFPSSVSSTTGLDGSGPAVLASGTAAKRAFDPFTPASVPAPAPRYHNSHYSGAAASGGAAAGASNGGGFFFAGGIAAASSSFVFSPLFDGLRGLSVDAQLSHARHLLADIQSGAAVSEALDTAVRTVVRQSDQARLEGLKKQAADVERDTKMIKEKWATDSVSLDHAVPPLTQHIESLATANAQSQKLLDELSAQIKSLEAEELLILEKKKQQSEIHDLASLNRRVLTHLSRYLRPCDLAALCRVSVRWNHRWDRGGLWRAICLRTAKRIERDSQTGREQKPYIPPHVSVVLENAITKKDKSNANADVKQKIFDKCLSAVASKVLIAQSETEDALSKTTTERQVKVFMSQQVADTRIKIGESRLEQWNWDKKMIEVQKEKSHVAKEISRCEREIVDLDRDKQSAEQNYRLTLKQLTERIQALKDIAQYAPQTSPASATAHGSQTVSDAERVAADAKIEQLKKDKKILVKGVKKLREELNEITRARDACQATIDALRSRMNGTAAAQ